MPEQLSDLQQVILEIDALGLTIRDSIRLVSARVGFFVGQQRYQEELRKARAIAEAGDSPGAVGTDAART